jgi:hypothetical protein
MKIEINNECFPPRKYYVEIEPQFTEFTKLCRVLPATYFDEPNTTFFLKAKYLPGEKKTFPSGGFELYGPEGSTHNFDLDQVIVHPYNLRMMNYFSKSESTVKDKVVKVMGDGRKRGRPRKNLEGYVKPAYVPTGGKKGRKKMSDEDRALRDIKLSEKKINSTGKKGRPRKQLL